jgi:hypothetical protein
MSVPGAKPGRPGTPVAILVGTALWAVSLVWWYSYYSQYGGAFELIEQKLVCIAVTTDACLGIQQKLIMSAIPAYHPELVWAGAIFLIIGFLQRRSRRV